MKLLINGKEASYAGPLTLASLIEDMGLKSDRVAVELNQEIVARGKWQEVDLSDGDRLEIVHFVGGGNILDCHLL
jgi:thiamine biosynthesis protein ThiS